ncbi:hydroxyproline-rich glycoprotein family protein [Striga asiatica]|uniref:Hydroxyproline-rich glycoprotein family protein n=1 Tax=Striga asiatica TaxID=4170 RepID=A0A5A7Q4P7_STRAF|nr:hydroxyproline-rich glycoprotein family protein [Striga asiatica]
MRLIRTYSQPANIALSRRFQQSQVFKTSVTTETSNLEHGSSIQWFARSYATFASSERVETKNLRRRIPKDERKFMILRALANRYREMNAGKFPTASEAKKDVGGSFYVVRAILQELVHESKMPPVDKKEDPREKIAIEKDEISTSTGEISRDSCSEMKPDQLPQPSILVENDESKDDGIESPNPTDKPTRRELPEVPSGDVEHKTSMWQNLKSFANGFFSIWKRS